KEARDACRQPPLHQFKHSGARTGQVGTLLQRDEKTGRWQVDLGQHGVKALLPKNLVLESAEEEDEEDQVPGNLIGRLLGSDQDEGPTTKQSDEFDDIDAIAEGIDEDHILDEAFDEGELEAEQEDIAPEEPEPEDAEDAEPVDAELEADEEMKEAAPEEAEPEEGEPEQGELEEGEVEEGDPDEAHFDEAEPDDEHFDDAGADEGDPDEVLDPPDQEEEHDGTSTQGQEAFDPEEPPEKPVDVDEEPPDFAKMSVKEKSDLLSLVKDSAHLPIRPPEAQKEKEEAKKKEEETTAQQKAAEEEKQPEQTPDSTNKDLVCRAPCRCCLALVAMALEKKFVWKQLAPMLDPFSVAVASMLNVTVRRFCVSPNGLLIVPHVILNCGEEAADQMVKCLPAIDKTEVTLVSFFDYKINHSPRDLDLFALCMGWLLGSFIKLRVANIGTFRRYGDRTCLWRTVLLNLQRHCRCLESLDCYCYTWPELVVKALPTFSNLLRLGLSVNSTSDCSASLLFERLADCSGTLQRLASVSFEVACDEVDCKSSLQRCMDEFSLTHVRILEDDLFDDTLPQVLSQIRWPSSCCMIALSANFSGEQLCALADEVRASGASGLYIHSLGERELTAAQVHQFLSTLERSSLSTFGWDQDLPAAVVSSAKLGLCSLVGNLPSLRSLQLGVYGKQGFASEDLTKAAFKADVCLHRSRGLFMPDCSGCCGSKGASPADEADDTTNSFGALAPLPLES
ncbi:MDN1, partial [Symbiodinium microadriaticum]